MRELVVVPVALLPALLFLLALVWLDSYKLTRPRTVLAVLAAGGLAAFAAYACNGALMEWLGWEIGPYSRTLGPVVEETLKAAIILALFQRHRIGFLVDAAILG